MEYQDTVVKLEARAKELNLSPREVYRRAQVKANNFSRWKLGQSEPRLNNFNRSIAKVEAVLAEEQQRLAALTAAQQE